MFLSKNFVKLVLVLVLCASTYVSAQPDWKWAKGFGLLRDDFGTSITTDASGNIYLAGEFANAISAGGTLTFPGGVTMTSQGNQDYYVAKFNSSGTALWARTAGSGAGAFTERGFGVALDNSGNVITCGEYMRTTTFQSGSNPNIIKTALGVNTEGFVAKYNSSGDLSWLRTQEDFLQEYAVRVATDPSNNSIVVGYFGGTSSGKVYDTLKINDQDSTHYEYGAPSRNWYVVKYDSVGHVLWHKSAACSYANSEPKNLVTDAAGNIYVVGMAIGDPFNIGSFALNLDTLGGSPYRPGSGGYKNDIIVAKYSPNGDVIWAKNFGGHNDDIAYGVQLDGLGNLYVGGQFDSAATFGSLGVITANGSQKSDAFLLKMDTTGNPTWIQTGGSSGNTSTEVGRSITIGQDGNVWVCGNFAGTATFSGNTVVSAGDLDVFIAEYDPSGTLLLINRGGGTGADNGMCITTSKAPGADLFVSGSYNSAVGGATFGSDNLTGVGMADFFFLKLGLRTLSLSALFEAMWVGGGETAMPNPAPVTVELHDASTYALVEAQTGTVGTDGVGTFNFSTVTSGTPYYIGVKSPTTVETWSANAESFTAGALSYDFTSGVGQAYTDGSMDPLKLYSGKYCIYSGDANQDGFVTSDDFTGIDNDVTSGDYNVENDLNGDLFITSDDFTFVDNNISLGVMRQVPPGAPSHLVKGAVKSHVQQKGSVN